MKKSVKRPAVPKAIQSTVLLANRHACCVCQKPRVQLHHVDGDRSNNDPANIAALCLDHHDMASMQVGLTKKLQPDQVRAYKIEWEKRCRVDITALSRERFTFYYCIYKNPPRLLEAYQSLSDDERRNAVERIRNKLLNEEARKKSDTLFGMNAVPRMDPYTLEALKSVYIGEPRPSYLGAFKPHPADPSYSTDSSPAEAMQAFHKYDLWCQIVGQTLAEARGTTPLEDLYRFTTEEDVDYFTGRLVTFRLTVRGKGVRIPKLWEQYATGSLQAKAKVGKHRFRIRMQLRTMYLFSDTAAINLSNGRVSGLGFLNGAVSTEKNEVEITIIPLLIGAGGWNLHPEHYPMTTDEA
jgi:hypothetical protein